MVTPPVPQRIVLGLDPEVREALARAAGDHHRPVAYEAEHLVVQALIEAGYLDGAPLTSPPIERLRAVER